MALVGALGVFFAAVLLWPALRHKRRTGEWGVVSQRGADPCQRLIGALMIPWMVAVGAWALALAWAGPAALGVWRGPEWLSWSGWAAMAFGLLLVVGAQAQMGASWRIGIDDRPTALVTGGPFAVARNPIFSGMLLALAGMVAISPAPATVVGWLAITQLIALQVRLEEQHLRRLHARAYADYASRVGRFMPGIGRLSAN